MITLSRNVNLFTYIVWAIWTQRNQIHLHKPAQALHQLPQLSKDRLHPFKRVWSKFIKWARSTVSHTSVHIDSHSSAKISPNTGPYQLTFKLGVAYLWYFPIVAFTFNFGLWPLRLSLMLIGLVAQLMVNLLQAISSILDAISSTEICSWIRQLLKDLGIYLAHLQSYGVNFPFILERVVCKDIVVKFICTHDWIADIFTKPLLSSRFVDLQLKLVVPGPTMGWGG